MISVGMRLPRKITGQKLGHYMHVFCVFCVMMDYCVDGMITMLCDEVV